MISSDEIFKSLNSIVVVKNNDQIVYVNRQVDLSLLDNKMASGKKIIASDGLEYELTVYRPIGTKYYDGSTGLYTKDTFEIEAQKYYDYATSNNEEFCVVFMDLDNFKKINDTYGHLNADKILKIVASSVKQNVRSTDLCARFGGDEFIILLKAAKTDVALKIVNQIQQDIIAINSEFATTGQLKIGASFGVASSSNVDSLEILLNDADMALYKAKQNKGSIEIYDEGRTR